MIVSPCIPGRPTVLAGVGCLPGEPVSFGKRAEVAVGVLKCNQIADEALESALELGISRETEYLRGSGEVLAGKLAGPRQQVAVRRSVAVAEHRQHCGICRRRNEQPLISDVVEIVSDGAAQLESNRRYFVGDRRIFRRAGGGSISSHQFRDQSRENEYSIGRRALHLHESSPRPVASLYTRTFRRGLQSG